MRFNDDPFRSEIETLVPRRMRVSRFEGLAPVAEEAGDDVVYGSGAYGVEAAWVEPAAPGSGSPTSGPLKRPGSTKRAG